MKNIILTGSSSGFGRITAQVLAKEGYHVFATMRNPKSKNQLIATYLSEWALSNRLMLTVVELDVTDEDSVANAMAEIAEATNGQIDVLINNAGIGYIGLNETLSAAQVDWMFQVNVVGADRMIKAVLPYMHERKEGLIINVSTIASRMPIPNMGIFSATKAALEALTISYYYELASVGIGIALIQPGTFPSTNIIANQLEPANPRAEAYYGEEMGNIRRALLESYVPGPFKPECIEVAYAIRNVIGVPSPFRSLWTIVRGGFKEQSVRYFNQATRELVDSFLEVTGVVYDAE
ncbi:MAG: SDR family NAD(P)-dependent oxidoreductase [Dyadobacter fermentans]